jgi:hypothetical protein
VFHADDLFIQNKSEYQNNDNSVYEVQTKKYEDKYLQDIRCVHKEWEFTEDEKKRIPELNNTFFNEYLENKNERIEDITKQIIDIEAINIKNTDFLIKPVNTPIKYGKYDELFELLGIFVCEGSLFQKKRFLIDNQHPSGRNSTVSQTHLTIKNHENFNNEILHT